MDFQDASKRAHIGVPVEGDTNIANTDIIKTEDPNTGQVLEMSLSELRSKILENPKVYRALMTQTGTSAPSVTVLENTVGTIVWTRSAAGTYVGTLSGAFAENKVFAKATLADPTTGHIGIARATNNTVIIKSADAGVVNTPTIIDPATPGVASILPALADAIMTVASIEILVYA